MAVYVDPLMGCATTPGWRHTQSCHMVADDLNDLHAFAKKIGLRIEWFQDRRLPHYDLTAKMRLKAVRAGAVEITQEELYWGWLNRPEYKARSKLASRRR